MLVTISDKDCNAALVVLFAAIFLLTVAPVNPGAPDAVSFSLSASTSTPLFLAISSRYLFQSVNDNFGLFLQVRKEWVQT